MLQMLELGSNRIRVGLLCEMLAGEFSALACEIGIFWKCSALALICSFVVFPCSSHSLNIAVHAGAFHCALVPGC